MSFKDRFHALLDRLVPTSPDFFVLLTEQCEQVTQTIRNLDAYMRTADRFLESELTRVEHEADKIKIRNLNELNRAFSTPIDREDIYRCIEALDWMVTHSKSTVNEMLALGIEPDKHMQTISEELLFGTQALQAGLQILSSQPDAAEQYAHRARHAHRRIERLYQQALGELFAGDNPVDMIRYREIYHHLMDSSRRLHKAANVVQDIMVKLV